MGESLIDNTQVQRRTVPGLVRVRRDPEQAARAAPDDRLVACRLPRPVSAMQRGCVERGEEFVLPPLLRHRPVLCPVGDVLPLPRHDPMHHHREDLLRLPLLPRHAEAHLAVSEHARGRVDLQGHVQHVPLPRHGVETEALHHLRGLAAQRRELRSAGCAPPRWTRQPVQVQTLVGELRRALPGRRGRHLHPLPGGRRAAA